MRESLSDRVRLSLRVELARRNWNATQLAERVGVSDMWVSRRMRGLTDFTVSDLDRVADALDVPVEVLLGERAA